MGNGSPRWIRQLWDICIWGAGKALGVFLLDGAGQACMNNCQPSEEGGPPSPWTTAPPPLLMFCPGQKICLTACGRRHHVSCLLLCCFVCCRHHHHNPVVHFTDILSVFSGPLFHVQGKGKDWAFAGTATIQQSTASIQELSASIQEPSIQEMTAASRNYRKRPGSDRNHPGNGSSIQQLTASIQIKKEASGNE